MTDFGTELREARERKGISLRQIAAATKISVGALEALERNDISRLPGGIFSRAFVRSYATEIGLDADETIRKFLAQFPAEAAYAQAATIAPAGPDARARGLHDSPVHDVEEEEFESKRRMAGVVLRLILISVPIAGAILYFSLRGNSSAGPREPRGDASAKPQVSAPTAADATPNGAVTSAPAPAAVPASTITPHSPAAKNAAAVAIEIAPTSDCWIHLMLDGDIAVARVVRAGERERREFSREAVLQVGDGAACAFTLNGRMARPLAGAGQVREVRITPTNYESFLP